MLRTKKNFYTRKPRECDVPARVALLFSFYNICLLVVCEILKSRNKTTPKYTALQEFIIDSFTLSKEFN